jgi:hypothetical protein
MAVKAESGHGRQEKAGIFRKMRVMAGSDWPNYRRMHNLRGEPLFGMTGKAEDLLRLNKQAL